MGGDAAVPIECGGSKGAVAFGGVLPFRAGAEAKGEEGVPPKVQGREGVEKGVIKC